MHRRVAGLVLVALAAFGLAVAPAMAEGSRKAPNQLSADTGASAVMASGIYRIEGLDQYGTSFFGQVTATRSRTGFDLIAWIGGRKYAGSAYVARGPVEIDWNAEHVTYQPSADGSLKGGWIGGGTSVLTLFARADLEAPAPQGQFEVEGHNPGADGTYRGILVLERDSGSYKATWQIQGSAIPGTGTLSDNVLVLDYGSTTPAIYAVQADGSLTGLWSSGAGDERLTPIP